MRGSRMLQSLIRSQSFLKSSALKSVCCPVRMCHQAAEQSGVHAGKVAVMTASTRGIGFAIARRLAQQGAHVVLSSRKQENVDKAIEDLKKENLVVSGIVCDDGKKEDRNNLLKLALEKHGGIDYLFSNAAYELLPKNVLDTSEEEWDKVLSLNVKAMFLLVQETYPHIQKRGGGSILLMSSVASYSLLPNIGAYSVSKAAVNGLTKVLAHALSPMNIRLNGLAPGLIKTDYSNCMWRNEEELKTAMQVNGFKRMGEPEECAGMASFLFSPDASYVTGEVFVVGGGFKTRL